MILIILLYIDTGLSIKFRFLYLQGILTSEAVEVHSNTDLVVILGTDTSSSIKC